MRPWTGIRQFFKLLLGMQLQWGHGLAAVDGRMRSLHARLLKLLQWGHGLAAVDGC